MKQKNKAKLPKGVFRRGSVLWIRYENREGKIVRESTGQTSVKLAEELYRKRKTEVAEGVHFPARRFDRLTFGELLDDWWEQHGKHRPNKFEYLLPRLERFKKMKARQITSDLVQQFLAELFEQEELSPSSVNHYRTIMNSVFNFAVKRRKYDHNPVSAVHQMTEPPGRDRFTTAEELNKLLDVCDREQDAELKAFILIAATTGLRKGSILPRRYAELVLDGPNPHIFVGRTKNGEAIKAPLPLLAIDAIKR